MNDGICATVIVPVYNVEKYLAECLDSILAQLEEKVEVICVDDCSTDASYEILLAYHQKDSRVKIFQNEKNQGLSCTRNRGIALAKGEYLLFVDSDDVLPETAISDLYQEAKKEELDMLFCDVEIMSEEGDTVEVEQWRKRKGLYHPMKGSFLFNEMVKNNEMFGAAWGVIYRRKYLTNNCFKFIEGILHEDIPFTFEVLLRSEKAGCILKRGYCYRQRKDSILHSNNLQCRLSGMIAGFFYMNFVWSRHNEPLEVNKAIVQYLDFWFAQIQNMYGELEDRSLNIDLPMLQYLFCIWRKKETYTKLSISKNDMEKLKENRYIAIYGAKKTAMLVLHYLNRYNIHVDCFLVSERNDNVYEIENIPVIVMKDLNCDREKLGIVIGVSERCREEVKIKLATEECAMIVEPI